MGCFKREGGDENEETSRMPSDSPFKQQKMKAWQPVLTASTVLPLFFLVSAIFIPIGIALLVSSSNIKEVVVEYSEEESCKKCLDVNKEILKDCNCTVEFELDSKWTGDIYFYYGLSNFYQNHRRYVRSKDDNQLSGNLGNNVNANCDPFGKINSTAIVPCGAIANSMFNDKFTLKLSTNSKAAVPWTNKDISWASDRETKFQNPSPPSELEKYFKPKNWAERLPGGLENEDFIVWMRVAAFPTFRKLYRRYDGEKADSNSPFQDGLPSGKYNLIVNYNFPVAKFGGKKRFVLTTSSWMGGKNPFLGTCYVVVGCLCLMFGLIFLFIHMKRSKSGLGGR